MTKKAPPPPQGITVQDLLRTTDIQEKLIEPLIADTKQTYGKWRETVHQFVDEQPDWDALAAIQQYALVILYSASVEVFLMRNVPMIAPLTDTVQ